MDIPVDLLDKALVLYREELERKLPEDAESIIHRLSAEITTALPENVQEYLEVTRLPNGGHQFQIIIPGCLPISLSFTQRMSGLELKLATVMNEETHKSWSTSNLMQAIGFAREQYLQKATVLSDLITSDLGSCFSK